VVQILEEQLIKPESENSACLSVVIPVYNEEATLSVVVRKLLLVPCLLEIIIVDDCSTDGTEQQARQLAEMHEQVRRGMVSWTTVCVLQTGPGLQEVNHANQATTRVEKAVFVHCLNYGDVRERERAELATGKCKV
jgi:glycosyltransferase involved in cell wall biosynthesis